MASVRDIIHIMEELAPARLAESWDHPGLQAGSAEWPVQSIWVALDPLPSVIHAACDQNVDLLITHHPLLFRPLASLDFNSPIGSLLYLSALNQLSIYASHTNLDKTEGGLNDMLSKRIGLKDTDVFEPSSDTELCKLVIFVPQGHEDSLLAALFKSPAGKIGSYSCCTFRNSGTGSFLPGAGSAPFIGKSGEVSHVDEVRIESVVRKTDVSRVLAHIRPHHPYQTMPADVYPLADADGRSGLGRIGDLEKSMTLYQFARLVKEKLALPSLKISGKPDMTIHRVAICSGSGSSLMKTFFSSDADVYLSGDLRYHDARDAESAGKALMDIGHFGSEHLMVDEITAFLSQRIAENSWDIRVTACRLEKDPFVMI
jgi:dinuclear metal center YbgI/SA1388 family protein